MSYFFTSESVSEGHPDKISDQISDALLDNFLAFDPESRVACETLVTTGQVILAGEVKSKTYLDVQSIARDTINSIGYTKSSYQFSGNSCGVISLIHEQSQDINRGVKSELKEKQGAGDQGIMFGYATNETETYIPLALHLSHQILIELSALRKENNLIKYLRPDSKSQVTIEYDNSDKPLRIDTIVISTQHDEFDDNDDKMLEKIKSDLTKVLIPRVKSKLPLNTRKLFDSIFIGEDHGTLISNYGTNEALRAPASEHMFLCCEPESKTPQFGKNSDFKSLDQFNNMRNHLDTLSEKRPEYASELFNEMKLYDRILLNDKTLGQDLRRKAFVLKIIILKKRD